ncbi:hypothetical protein IIA79_05470 [bacterium]|nr:hypothetical protein [bacterium]
MAEAAVTHGLAKAKASRSHLARIFEILSALGGTTSPTNLLEEEVYRIREGFHNFRLEPVEQEHPDTDFRSAPRPDDVHLVYFSRVLQRTQLVGHFLHQGREIPLHYSLTGAIILKRVDGKFSVWDKPEVRANVIVPFKFVNDRSVVEGFESDEELKLVDSGGDRQEYTQLRIDAVRKAREVALEMRALLLRRWSEKEGADASQFIVAEGMIADVDNETLTSNFLGLASQVYVPWQNSELLEPQLCIPAYHRGQVMRIVKVEGDDPGAKYTWFVRLRDSAKADPEFGLVRCTCIAKSKKDSIERADSITARIIDERLPVTFPAENWDKLIFPLKLCKDYLESLIPTRDTVKSYFARN